MMRLRKFVAAIFLLCLWWTGQRVWGQSNCSYLVVDNGGYSLAQIDQAFAQASLDAYRLKSIRRTMKFTNGAEVELYSATELQNQGCPVNGTLAMEDNTPLDAARRFEIHPSGVIYEPVQAVFKR
jgi:hypothetical protein